VTAFAAAAPAAFATSFTQQFRDPVDRVVAAVLVRGVLTIAAALRLGVKMAGWRPRTGWVSFIVM
jgi:hypothetical protein